MTTLPAQSFASIAARLACRAALLSGALLAAASAQAADTAPSLPAPSAQPPAVVADWITRNTSIPLASIVSVGDEYIVAVLSSRPLNPATPRLLHVEMRAEMTNPDSRDAGLLRSLAATVDVNCGDHATRFIRVQTFKGPNLSGEGSFSAPTDGWVADPPGSYLADINAAVCQPDGRRLLANLGNAANRPTATRTAYPSATTEQAVTSTLRPAQSADSPLPAPAPPQPPKKIKPAVIVSHAAGGGEAQIAAGASPALAQAALSEVKGALPAATGGLSTRVERIERNGKAYYRALVFGFAPPADARSFCRQLSAAGRACIVR